MPWETIVKSEQVWRAAPNLRDYERSRAAFDWGDARRELDGLPGGQGLNIAYEAVDRHAAGPLRDKIAIRWLGMEGAVDDFTYRRLQSLTNRFAGALKSLGVGKGDRVFVLSGRIPELYIAALGALKNRSVFCPLFSAFGPEPIKARLSIGDAKVLVTTTSLYRRKVAGIRAELPSLEHVILINDDHKPLEAPGGRDYHALMEAASDRFTIAPTEPDDMALLHFTSGTTGTPKGAIHVHKAVVAHHITGKLALDLHPDDVFWCTADPGWVTGTSYGIIAPLTNGVTSIVDEGDFDADRWYGIVQAHQISVWYTAPTAIRMMMRAGVEATKNYDLGSLRFLASVGEPLNPEAVVWGREAFGLPFHDNWWQTETGGIMIANYAAMDIRPGSMGRPLPGIEAAIVRQSEDGRIEAVTDPDVEGELALRPGWPSMFRGYWNEPQRYQKCFAGGYYLTGDLAKRDDDGYFWFVGRKDDVIKTSGHLVGPFEVESVLLEHEAVAEAGVIGKPDPVALEIVKAFVAIKPGYEPSDALARELLAFARVRLGAAVAPKELSFIPAVPKNRAGKIMRRLLKARELGLPEGDTSTLEGAATEQWFCGARAGAARRGRETKCSKGNLLHSHQESRNDMSNVLTHNEMHSDHRLWNSEETLWEDDVQIWEGELDAALAEMKQLEEVLAEHRNGLESHAETIRAARAERAKHEHALAEYEHGETGEDLVVLAQKHEEEAEKHCKQRQTHERVKCHHHTVMAHWRLLFKALSKEM